MDDRPDIPSPDSDPDARLCDYLEGDLDPAGRAEVERLLARRTRDRAVVADLLRHRSALRDLPPEAAPPEIYEEVMGGLERSALLDATNDYAGSSAAFRWTRLLAVAAVALLGIGLTVATLYLLPGGAGGPTVATSVVEKAVPKSMPPKDLPIIMPPAPGQASNGPAAPQPKNRLKDELTSSPPPALMPAPVARGVARETAKQVDKPAPPLVLLVSTDDLKSADAQVTGYLARNSIAYEPAPEAEQRFVFGAAKSSVSVLAQSLGTDLVPTTAQAVRTGQQLQAQAGKMKQMNQRQNAQILAQAPADAATPPAAPAGGRTILAYQMTATQASALADELNAAPPDESRADLQSAATRAATAPVRREVAADSAAYYGVAPPPATRPVDVLIVLQYAPQAAAPAGAATRPAPASD